MTFDMLKKLGRQSSVNFDKVAKKCDMNRDESETSRCCDFSAFDESSSNDDESKLIELQDDLKAKTLQLDILRETLSTMSATMRRQEFQLEGKDAQIETYIRLMEEKIIECNEWKEKYEVLVLKIENRVYESENVQQQPNFNIPPVSKVCDPLRDSRPWQSAISHNITTIRDDTSTSSDSISHSYAETELIARRCPRRSFRLKRLEDGSDVVKLLVLNDQEFEGAPSRTSFEVITTCDEIEHDEASHGLEDTQHELNRTTNSEHCVSPFEISNDNNCLGMELTEFDNLQEDEFESEVNLYSIHNEVESVGFNFEVEIPFSDTESVEKSNESGCELEGFDGSPATSSEVEILSLHHFIQMYDQYQIEDEDGINCAADLSAATKDDDDISVISNASLDSSTDPTTSSTNKKERVSVASLSSSLTSIKANGITNTLQHKSLLAQRKKVATKLRKRIIRTAKREAKKAQFNCEAVEC